MGRQTIFWHQTPPLNYFFCLSFDLRHHLGQSNNFSIGNQLSEIGLLKIYLYLVVWVMPIPQMKGNIVRVQLKIYLMINSLYTCSYLITTGNKALSLMFFFTIFTIFMWVFLSFLWLCIYNYERWECFTMFFLCFFLSQDCTKQYFNVFWDTLMGLALNEHNCSFLCTFAFLLWP